MCSIIKQESERKEEPEKNEESKEDDKNPKTDDKPAESEVEGKEEKKADDEKLKRKEKEMMTLRISAMYDDDQGQPSRPSISSIDQSHQLIRKYQAWKGNNVFCLQGRLIFGPDVSSLPLSVFLIVAPATLFSVFVGRKFIDDFHHWGVSIIVAEVLLTAFVLAALLLTSSRDPGIVPRNVKSPEPVVNDQESTERILQDKPLAELPRFKEEVVNGITVRIKYCETCKLYRPPRCSHCSVCDNCVERFDHHCPWVGQCIGLRNYRFYYMFVSSATALCVYIFSFCWIYITMVAKSEDISIWKSMAKAPVPVALIVYSFISVWFVGGLTVFHTFLISRNQSTYENFRYRFDRQVNPHNKGCYRNFKGIFWSSIPASKNNFREKVAKEVKVHSNKSISFDHARPNVQKAMDDIQSRWKTNWNENEDDDIYIMR